MPEKILGLDIGAASIKAVQVTTGLKGYRIVDTLTVDIDAAGGLDEAVKAVFDHGDFRSGICVSSISSKRCSFRRMSFPFRDRKKIAQAIAFEMEPLIPCPVDDVLIDFISISEKEGSRVLAAAVPAELIDAHRTLIEERGGRAVVIDIDAVPVAAKLITAGDATGDCILIDVGENSSTAVLITGGRIAHVRHFAFGGRSITTTIADVANMTVTEAEQRKREGRVTGAERETVALCRDFASRIARTIDFLSARGDVTIAPTAIFLTGGGALYSPLKGELEARFPCPVELVSVGASANIQMSSRIRDDWNSAIMNQALALATGETKRGLGFNFGPGEYSPWKMFERVQKDLRWVAALCAIILCAAGVNLYIDYHYDRVYLQKLDAGIRDTFTEVLPEVTRIVNPVHQLRVKINETKQAALDTAVKTQSITALMLLKDISSLIPQSTEFTVTTLTYDGDSAEIKGSTDNFNTADAIKNHLAQSRYIKKITISSAKMNKKDNKVDLSLRVDLQGSGHQPPGTGEAITKHQT